MFDSKIFKPNPRFIKGVLLKVRKRWHDALIATKVGQARNQMLVDGNMCCLMVAHEEWQGADSERDEGTPLRKSPFVKALGGFPNGWDLKGLPSTNPQIAVTDDGSTEVSAGSINDDHNGSFKDIARLVYPEGYAS